MNCGCNNCFPNPCTCVQNCKDICSALTVQNSWNVPDCVGTAATAILSIPGLKNVFIGAYIWNADFGYFRITAFNSITAQVTVVNDCFDDNAAPGTAVPANTKFIIATPQAFFTSVWSPVITANGAMTVSAVTIYDAKYFTSGRHVWFRIGAAFTLGGVQDTTVYISLPTPAVNFNSNMALPCTASQAAGWKVDSTPRIAVVSLTGGNWLAGATSFQTEGFYESA